MRSQPEPHPPELEAAVDALLAGELVAFPTETVYGLGADASNAGAVAAIFAAKGRPSDHPVIVHLASASGLAQWTAEPSASAVALADAFWPGPLTLLVPRAAHVLDAVTGGRTSVGLRVPSHPVAHALLTAFAARSPHGGVAAPSANRFGRVSPTSAADVHADLGDRVRVVLDGGHSSVGVESTIVDCTVEPPMILRHGAITTEMLEVVVTLQDAAGPSRTSGMLASHYAPRCTIVAVETVTDARHAMRLRRDLGELVDVFDASRDVHDAAHRLYREFRNADELGLNALIVVLPNAEGLGRAIRDRVLKASAADRAARRE
jgi:L-threonylcarbamoyladenylate synthase